MLPDRELQRTILERLRDVYPSPLETRLLFENFDSAVGIFNLRYLEEHGLVNGKWVVASGEMLVADVRITAAGLDFLADDGGLSAILGVVTVRLHEDTIKALLIEQVERSSAPDDLKTKLKSQIKSLPAEALKTVTTEGLKAGLTHIPDAMSWLEMLLRTFSN